LEVGVRQLFKGGKYSREETINYDEFGLVWSLKQKSAIIEGWQLKKPM
jgi:hypothetical protein